MKFGLVSHALPPSASGQAVTLWHLLRGVPAEGYCLMSGRDWEGSGAPGLASQRLPANYYRLPEEFVIRRGYRFGVNWARQGFNIPYGVARRARRIRRILEREGCRAVVACTGELLDLPAAYLAARGLGLPFYAYIFDHYSYREWYDPVMQAWARRIESKVFRRAEKVIAVNEVLRDDLRSQYGVEPALIHNSFDIRPYAALADEPFEPRPDGEVRIVYTGAIYEAHYDAFRNLLAALERLGRPEVKLHAYTTQRAEEMAGRGIGGPAVVFHPHLSVAEMPGVQRRADLLFLPLAFESPYPDLVRTSAPVKFGEYLASRRPVLVHAPPRSFISWYCREHDCGLVVDESDPRSWPKQSGACSRTALCRPG